MRLTRGGCTRAGAIRALLRQYEQRPPPLAPIAASLRALLPLCDDLEAPGAATRCGAFPACAPNALWCLRGLSSLFPRV